MKKIWLSLNRAKVAVIVFALALCGGISAQAGTIASQTNTYAFGADPMAVVIDSRVDDMGSFFLWEYTVTNNSFDPAPGSSNGFSGFELALPGGFPPDLGNVTSPGPGWLSNCCSGLPMEWDIINSTGLGIMPGNSGIFSFTTLPRFIQTADAGWFHTWQNNTQTFIVNYGAGNAPLAPDLLRPPTAPEFSGMFGGVNFGWLASLVGLAGLLVVRRKPSRK